jgi:hypothetical protein
MSTRCIVGYKDPNTQVYRGVYVHSDGYPEYMMPLLITHYNSLRAAKNIVKLGSISILAERLYPTEGSKHSFENPEKDVTVAYHRDRREEFEVYESENESILLTFAYGYLYDENIGWRYYSKEQNKWVKYTEEYEVDEKSYHLENSKISEAEKPYQDRVEFISDGLIEAYIRYVAQNEHFNFQKFYDLGSYNTIRRIFEQEGWIFNDALIIDKLTSSETLVIREQRIKNKNGKPYTLKVEFLSGNISIEA